ncbi:hypothetical protein ACHAWC_007901 [Mediolabrus comicus]
MGGMLSSEAGQAGGAPTAATLHGGNDGASVATSDTAIAEGVPGVVPNSNRKRKFEEVDQATHNVSQIMDSQKFVEDGRHHHTTDPPNLGKYQVIEDSEMIKTWKDINNQIEQRNELRIKREENKKGRKFIPSNQLLMKGGPLCRFIENEAPNTIAQLEDEVEYLVGKLKCNCTGPSHTLESFCDDISLRKQKISDAKKIRNRVARRMVLHYGLYCCYCKAPCTPSRAKMYYGWSSEHMSCLGEKNENVSAINDSSELMEELRNTYPCCILCNRIGDNKRTYVEDRSYQTQIPIEDSEMGRHVRIGYILGSRQFQDFTTECRNLGLDTYYNDYDENGRRTFTDKGGKLDFEYIPCYDEVKYILWKHYPGILLDDIVTFRKINDYYHPRGAFRMLVKNLVLVLSCQCFGPTKEENCDSPWRNLRNLAPHQYQGIHLDHFDGNERQVAQGTNWMLYTWDKFLEYMLDCVVKCGQCHMSK